MANSTETMARLDGIIFSSLERAGMTDVMNVGSTEVTGYFNRVQVQAGDVEDLVVGESITFDCLTADLPSIDAEQLVEIEGQGTFRYMYAEAHGIGRSLVCLGSLQP